MPRKKVLTQNIYPYHVYNRSIDKGFFGVPMPLLWKIFCREAYFMSTLWNGKIHSLVLMGNHFHMCLSTPDANIGQCMADFQSEIARSISKFMGSDGYRFQSRYQWSMISTTNHFRMLHKYIYQNPVRANLCSRVEEYPFSTLHGLLGRSALRVPIAVAAMAPELFHSPADEYLPWLNEMYGEKEFGRIGAGLRKSEFSPTLTSTSKTQRDLLKSKTGFNASPV